MTSACGPGCISCEIPGFGPQSTIGDVMCAECLPGYILHNGNCTSPYNFSACNPPCSSCSDDLDFCLTCTGGQMASQGKCMNTCPDGTYQSTNASTCVPCHPDCNTCSGSNIDQCKSCGGQLPVLSNGRCLLACGGSQYYDGSSCQDCDPSCSSCAGPGPGNCLACSNGQTLDSGFCVKVKPPCDPSDPVIPGLEVCLTQLLTNINSAGVANPEATTSPRKSLTWWQIFLTSIGVLIFVVCLVLLWRFRARRRREAMTNEFAQSKHGGLTMQSASNLQLQQIEDDDLAMRRAMRRRAMRRHAMRRHEMDRQRRLDDHEMALRQHEWRGLSGGPRHSLDRSRRRWRRSKPYRSMEDFQSENRARDSVPSFLSYRIP
jgi:hypothetical protein